MLTVSICPTPHPPFCEYFVMCFNLDYDSMYSETDFREEKVVFSCNYWNPQFLL